MAIRHRSFMLTTLLGIIIAPASGQVVLRVDPAAGSGGDGLSWATAFQHLQPALEAAALQAAGGTNVQIWLAAGTYAPTRRTIASEPDSVTFELINRVAVLGGFAGAEVTESQRDPATNVTELTRSPVDAPWHLVTADGTDQTAVLDGVTIRDNIFGGDSFAPHNGGAGMFVFNASPIVANCRFLRNEINDVFSRGGAVLIHGGAPRFIGCAFQGNVAGGADGGAIGTFSGSPVLSGCTFQGNRAEFAGGALAGAGYSAEDCLFLSNFAFGAGALHGGGTFRRCLFQANTDGVVIVYAPTELIQCEFIDNASVFGFSVVQGTAASVSAANCEFRRNTAPPGSVLGLVTLRDAALANCVFNSNSGAPAVATFGPSRIVNCTFYNNADRAVEVRGGTATVINSLFWNNTLAGVADEAAQISGNAVVNYTFVHGLTGLLGGIGNRGGSASPNPNLADADGVDNTPGTPDDDLRPTTGSVCIDAGMNPAIPLDALDLDIDGVTSEELPLDAAMLPRRVNDPATPDTGVGGAPVVDLGAFELQEPACLADWNRDETLDSGDFFAFLTAFFANSADFNADNVTNSADFFDYLNAFFAGC